MKPQIDQYAPYSAIHVQETLEEARGAIIYYGFWSRVFLDAIEVPGTDRAIDLARSSLSLAEALRGTNAEMASDLIAWARAILELQERTRDKQKPDTDPAKALQYEQEALAADRTFLMRGISERAPLPPYEGYHRASAGSTDTASLSDIDRCYRKADIHPDEELGERSDYAGIELAFLAELARREETALTGDAIEAAANWRTQRESFEAEHIRAWLPQWCQAASDKARTPFFKAGLALLGATC